MIEDPILYVLLRIEWSVVLCHVGVFHVYDFEDFDLVVELWLGELFGCGLDEDVVGVMEGVDACLGIEMDVLDVVGEEELFGHLLLHAFVEVLGEFDLVLLLQLDVVLYIVLGSFSWFLLVLFVFFIEL